MHFRRITSIYQPTNAHIISRKTHLKHFKTLRHVSILSDHQGALFLAKVILRYSQFISYLQTRCCGSISCYVPTGRRNANRQTYLSIMRRPDPSMYAHRHMTRSWMYIPITLTLRHSAIRRLLLSSRSGLKPRKLHARFVVDKVAM